MAQEGTPGPLGTAAPALRHFGSSRGRIAAHGGVQEAGGAVAGDTDQEHGPPEFTGAVSGGDHDHGDDQAPLAREKADHQNAGRIGNERVDRNSGSGLMPGGAGRGNMGPCRSRRVVNGPGTRARPLGNGCPRSPPFGLYRGRIAAHGGVQEAAGAVAGEV